MFYMQLLMNKRGPLAKIWLAAHWDKKLTKAHIFECNLETTIEKMLSPRFTIALRTSGHLLLGVVRIYHRKAKYLLADCNEALLKMQTAFRPGLVDLPKGNSEANYDAITLPEEFHDFDTQLPDVNAIDVVQHFTLNQSKAEDITLIEEDYRLLHGDSFGGDNNDVLRHSGFFSDSFLAAPSPSDVLVDRCSLSVTADKNELDEDVYILKHDGFGDEGVAEDMIDHVLGAEQNGLIGLFDMEEDIHLPPSLPVEDTTDNPRFNQEAISHPINETTLLSNEEEGFVLEPIDDSVLIKKQRSKRKRKLLVDVVKEISRSNMENQLLNYKDTLATLDIAPPTKRLMVLKELGSVAQLLNTPTHPLINEDLKKLFVRSLGNGRKIFQQEAEVEERRKEQAAEKPGEESPNNLQGSVSLESQSWLQSDRRENSSVTFEVTEAANLLSTLSDGSSLNFSVRQESENDQAPKENELQGNDLENEEKRRYKRTLELLNIFKDLDQTGAKSFSFLALCRNKKSKEVASKFCSLLVLKKKQAVEVAQAAPYADIIVTVGPKFYLL